MNVVDKILRILIETNDSFIALNPEYDEEYLDSLTILIEENLIALSETYKDEELLDIFISDLNSIMLASYKEIDNESDKTIELMMNLKFNLIKDDLKKLN